MLKKLIALIFLFCATQVFAATEQTINEYTDEFIDALNARTELTLEEKKALRPVLFDSLNAREDVIASYMGQQGLSVKRQIRDALTPINENLQSKAQKILTPEQFDAFKQVQSRNQDAVRERINRDF